IMPFLKRSSQRLFTALDGMQKKYVFFVLLGPWLLTLLAEVLRGEYFPPRWATPYFFLIGLAMVLCLPLSLTQKRLKLFQTGVLLFTLFLWCARMWTFTEYAKQENDAFLPNQQMAHILEDLWWKKNHRPLKYLVG